MVLWRERLSRLPNFIGDYHNVPCLWTGSIVAPLALSGYAAGFARGKAWILEVHYRRTQVDRYTYLLLGMGFSPDHAAGVGLDDRYVARQSDNLHATSTDRTRIRCARKSMCGPSIKRPINSFACHTSIKNP